MKKIQFIVIVLTAGLLSITAQEKKINFNKGTLTICSKKTFLIEGYDGKEVVIEPIHEVKKAGVYVVNGVPKISGTKNKATTFKAKGYSYSIDTEKRKATNWSTRVNKDGKVVFRMVDKERQKGLKKLGKTNENEELGIYFDIEQKDGELFFKDLKSNGMYMLGNDKYKLKIPNSLKLNWLSGNCTSNKKKADQNIIFLNSDESIISNFEGEVVINSTMRNTKLVDVSGPVSLNSLGGNFTIIFDKTKPNNLYSVYSNNGFIDVTLPEKSSLNVTAAGKSVFSDLDFKILEEKEINDFGHLKQEMKLKLNSGKVRMNLNAGYGNVYLRKQ